MAIPKKNSRTIVVDGITYRWRLRFRPTYQQAALEGSLLIAIESSNAKGCTLIVDTQQTHPNAWRRPSNLSVTPAQIANHIRQGLKNGWQPAEPGKQFRLMAESASTTREAAE